MGRFAELMNYFKFDKFPRRVGNPASIVVNNYDEFYAFMRKYSGITPLYTSHNSIPTKTSVYYEQMMWDIDTDHEDTTLEMALQDLRKLVRFYENIDKVVQFSGEGFHLLLRVEASQRDLTLNFSEAIRQYEKEIVDKLNLHTVNTKCGEPVHLFRIPSSLHVDDFKRLGVRYAIPLSLDAVDGPLEKIIQQSQVRNLNMRIDNSECKPLSMERINTLMNNISITFADVAQVDVAINWYEKNDYDIINFARSIWPETLFSNVMSPTATNQMRVLAAIYFFNLIRDLAQGQAFFDRIAEIAKWTNGPNVKRRHYAVEQVFYHQYPVKI